MKAVILAAGKGLRFKPLTNEIPKGLVEVNKKSILQRELEALEKAGIRDVGLVVGYKKEKIIEKFGKNFGNVKLQYLPQEHQFGTANAVYQAKNFVGKEEFISINGDLLFEPELILDLISCSGFDAVLVGRKEKEPWHFGVLKLKGELVKDIIEKPEKGKEPSDLVNCGIYRFNSNIFPAIEKTRVSKRKEFEITDSIKFLIKEERVRWIPAKGKLFDLRAIEDLKKTEKEIE